jgi:ArsR family transcriptional regulator, arsenate/arsenite/antimonite-responsive transcriptional repressor
MDEVHLAKIAKALADHNRTRILRLLQSHDKVPLSTVLDSLSITGATLSHHTRALESACLITIERQKNSAFLSLRRDVLNAYADWLLELY